MKRRFTIGFAMGVIFVITCALAAVDRVRRDGERERFIRAQLPAQEGITEAILLRAERDLITPEMNTTLSQLGGGSSPEGWHVRSHTVVGHDCDMIDLEVKGSKSGTELQPIRIIDKGGKLNGEVIKRLTEEYSERGWKYVVEHAEGPTSHPTR